MIKFGARLVSTFLIVSVSIALGVSSLSFLMIFLPKILFAFDTPSLGNVVDRTCSVLLNLATSSITL